MVSSESETYPPIHVLQQRVEDAVTARRPDEEVAALRALLAHPCAHHELLEYKVLDDLHRALRRVGSHDEAIATKRAAIAAGCRSSPDPEADIAETLLEAGRRDEADALYAELRERDPDDVWLNNSAGHAYRGVDDREALRWLLAGIELAIATGDRDRLVEQLHEMAQRQRATLGEPEDDALAAQVRAFVAAWKPVPFKPGWAGDWSAPAERHCDHCGFEPDPPPQPSGLVSNQPFDLSELTLPRTRQAPTDVALAWFPAGQWALARARWPELEDLPADHALYSHRIEARMKWFAKQMPGYGIHVSPLIVDELVAAEGELAGTGEARSQHAVQLMQEGRALPWPPGRNDRCWCGSGRKYKLCCGPTAPAIDEPDHD